MGEREGVKMQKYLFSIFLLSLSLAVPAHPQTISTDRPGFGNGTSIVPVRAKQLESGYLYSRVEEVKEHTLGQWLLRIGAAERLEFRIGVNSYVSASSPDGDDSGISDGSLGLKLKLYHGEHGFETLTYDLSVVVETSLPTGSKPYRARRLQPAVMFVLDLAVPQGFTLSPFTSYTLASDDTPQYNQFGVGVSLGVSLTERTGCFLEYFGLTKEKDRGPETTNYLDGGFTFLLADNCQLDIHSGLGMNGPSPSYFVGIGFSYLFAR